VTKDEKVQLSLILRNLENRVKEVELTLGVLRDRLEKETDKQMPLPDTAPEPENPDQPKPEYVQGTTIRDIYGNEECLD
jgi:hypothetical protein